MDTPLVTLATYETPFEAEIVRGRLQDDGITALVGDAEVVTADWMMSHAIGGVKLRVPEAEIERARALLAELAEQEGDAFTQAEDLANRAFRASVTGLALPPLQLYAVYLLARYVAVAEDEAPRTRRRVTWAVVFLVPYAALLAAIVLS